MPGIGENIRQAAACLLARDGVIAAACGCFRVVPVYEIAIDRVGIPHHFVPSFPGRLWPLLRLDVGQCQSLRQSRRPAREIRARKGGGVGRTTEAA